MKFKERPDAKTSVTMPGDSVFGLYISKLAFEKMQAYVELYDKEIGWVGWARQHNGLWLLEDVELPKQEAHGATCELDPTDLGRIGQESLQREIAAGYEGEEMIARARYNVWGHSHVNMGVGPSGQDAKQFKDFAQGMPTPFFRIIANKKGEMKIDVIFPGLGIQLNDISWIQHIPTESGLREAIEAEIKEKVKAKTTYVGGYTRGRVWDSKAGKWKEPDEKKTTPTTTLKTNTTTVTDTTKKNEIDKSEDKSAEILQNTWVEFVDEESFISDTKIALSRWVTFENLMEDITMIDLEYLLSVDCHKNDELLTMEANAYFGIKNDAIDTKILSQLLECYIEFILETEYEEEDNGTAK